MKKQIFLTTLLLLGVIGTVSAQGTFKVIASSGSTTKGGVGLKIGTSVLASDQITVGAKSYLGLSYAKGGTVQISKAGTYSAKDLETKLLASSKSSSQKYAEFIIGEVVKGGDANIHKNPYAHQNVTGSVERAVYGISVDLPITTEYLEAQYTFTWKKVIGGTNYNIQIFNNFDEVVKNVTTQDTTYTINFASPELKDSDFVKLVITAKEVSFPDNQVPKFSFIKEENFANKKAKIDKFKKGLGENYQEDAHKQLEFALYLEEQKMLLDAKLAYEKAVKLEPENSTMQAAYEQFKIRYGIGKAPEANKGKE